MALPNGIPYDSGCTELNKKLQEWLEWDKNERTHVEIKSLALTKDWDALRKRLCNRLAFGTAGLRGVMQAGFDSMNDLVVIQTAQGLVQYILDAFPNISDHKKGIVLGFDGRYNSKRFAELSACVFLSAGIHVWLFSKMVPTPFVPFTIINKGCLAGIMVTASHNPKEDNGYKVYWNNGAQIIYPHDKNIQKSILENLIPLETSWDTSILDSDHLEDPFDEIFHLYYKRLLQNIPSSFVKCNENSQMQFVYTAMHGVGYPFVQEAFKKANLNAPLSVKEQQEADPEFPTVKFPNPEEGKSCLLLSIDLANKNNVSVILANDPDADRLACAEKNQKTGQWKVFSGNELGALLGWWSVRCFLENNQQSSLCDCYLLASTVSSKILHSMAKIDGFNFVETLTGFKWMGNKCVDLLQSGKKVLFAFEEAIGFMFSPSVLDKDGVSAACHLATVACYLKQHEGLTLDEKLNQLYEKYGYHYAVTSYFLCYDPLTIKKIFERIRNFNGEKDNYPISVLNGKFNITSIRDLTTGKDTSQSDGKALLPTSSSTQMITFSFENGVVLTLRTSGTEPKIKYYAEMCARPGAKDWELLRQTLTEVVDAVVEELLQPEMNGLTPKSG